MQLDYIHFTRLIHELRDLHRQETSPLPAAVMMLFVDRPKTHVLFIEKTKTQGYPWSGHVAFPGGRIQDRDATPLAAALREVEEELGITSRELTVLGPLGSFVTRKGGISLHVFAAKWSGAGSLTPDRKEIAEVFEIELERLINLQLGRYEPDPEIRFEFAGRTIWGVTARILHAVLEILLATSPRPGLHPVPQPSRIVPTDLTA